MGVKAKSIPSNGATCERHTDAHESQGLPVGVRFI